LKGRRLAGVRRPVLMRISGTEREPSRAVATITYRGRVFIARHAVTPAFYSQQTIFFCSIVRGDPYTLPHPCKRTAAGWVSSKGRPLAVTPIKWKLYIHSREKE
jgi:hypothetical protein